MQVYVIIQIICSDIDEQTLVHSVWGNESDANKVCEDLNNRYDEKNLNIDINLYRLIWVDISNQFFKIYEDWSGDEDEIFKGKLAESIVVEKYNQSFEDWIDAYEVYEMTENNEYIRFRIEKYEVM